MSKIHQNYGNVISTNTKAASANISQAAKVLQKRRKEREIAKGKQQKGSGKGGTRQPANLLGVPPTRKRTRRHKYYNYNKINCHRGPHTYNMITYIPKVPHRTHKNIIHKYTHIVIKLLLYTIYFYLKSLSNIL